MPPPPNADLSYVAHIRIVPSVIAGAFAVGLIATVAGRLPARSAGHAHSGGGCAAAEHLTASPVTQSPRNRGAVPCKPDPA